ncbi:MAG: YIP1 family protein [Lachnospiraceae bacterium]|nr:Yip1 family protein [uncultured Acetatifactor sp.]MCI9219191.1 YIP1 family protein [Lachnospiraceae bacterium]
MKEKKTATNPFYTIMHPFDCSYDIRFKEKGNTGITIVILLFFFLTSIFQRQNTGYIFNDNKLSDLNVFLQFISVALPFVLFVISNWVVAILMNGTGRFRDIWIYTAYCCIPFILGNIVSVLLSNVLVREEPFGGYVQVFGAAWSLVILFIGLMIMHEYGFTQNLFSCVCTIFVMFILLFLIMLVGNLATDLYGFVMTVVKEITFRMS